VNVLMISPGYPAEMAYFTRGLAQAGAAVIGLGDQPVGALPGPASSALAHYVHVGSLADENAVRHVVADLARQMRISQVECLWEPYMILAARLREDLGLPGLTVAQTVPFRDKEAMIRTTGKPVREPVAYGGDVGKPYEKGSKVPEGVNVRSALSPERPQKLQARGENRGHGPRPIEHDIQPMTPRPEDRPERVPAQGKPGMPGPHGPRPGAPATASAGGEMPPASGQPARPGPSAQPAQSAEPADAESTKGHGGKWQKMHQAPPQAGAPAEERQGAAPKGQPESQPAPSAPSSQPSTSDSTKAHGRWQRLQRTPPPQQQAAPGAEPAPETHGSGSAPAHHGAPTGGESPRQAKPAGNEGPSHVQPAETKEKDSKGKESNAKKPEPEKKKKKKD